MERIVYRKTLDVHKNGVQFTLQGFETADKMARKIEISLMASGDTIDLPLEQLSAIMYVTTPNATEPSINECTIKDNTIIYDVIPIVEKGITEMQLKLIETRVDGAKGVIATPKFAIEVSESNTNEESALQTITFTALENALASARGVYNSRLIKIELDTDCTFRAVYADGTAYESDVLKETVLKGEAILSQSYARGNTGVRVGEETDNSMYYSNVSKSASDEAQRVSCEATELLEEVTKHSVYTSFSLDFLTGELKYISPLYTFSINQATGELDANGETYTPENTINTLVTNWLISKSEEIISLRADLTTLKNDNAAAHEKLNFKITELSDFQNKMTNAMTSLEKENATAHTKLQSQIEGLSQSHTALSKDLTKLSENVDVKTKELNNKIDSKLYPVGSVFITNKGINPNEVFGGTWAKQTVLKSVGGKIMANIAEGNKTYTFPVDVLEFDILSNTENYHITVTPLSGSPQSCFVCVGDINSVTNNDGNKYLSFFDVYAFRNSATSFPVFWHVTGESYTDNNGNYHWKRIV